jgi:hypothetical protein
LLEVSDLDITQRGEKGFGSTGKRKTKKVKQMIKKVKVKVIKLQCNFQK